MEKYLSPIKQGLKAKMASIDDDVAHEIALALTEASQKGGSPLVSQTPKRKRGTPSPVQKDSRMVIFLISYDLFPLYDIFYVKILINCFI